MTAVVPSSWAEPPRGPSAAVFGEDSGVSALRTSPPTRWEELTPGLLLFFARPSLLQSWAERWGHPFRHVAITVQTPNGLRVASYSAKQCYRIDDLEALMPNYNRIAVASVEASDAEKQAISDWCSGFEDLPRKQAPYTKSAFVIGPLKEIARLKTGALRSILLTFLVLYCRFQDVLGRRRPAFGCSTFVWRALVECTDNRLRLPMTAHPDDQTAYATPVTDRDDLLARWLCGPGDLWSAISESHRAELELDHLHEDALGEPDELVIDLRDDVGSDETNSGAATTGRIRAAAGLVSAAAVVSTVFFAERLLGTG